jgi:Domain of Unknown Function with PDB structure (DUF3857)/Protein of unknown function (DUF2569)
MRIALTIILCLLLTRPASANSSVQTGPLPGWLAGIHPDPNKRPASGDISNGYYYELLDLQTNLLHHTEYTHFIKNIVNESGVQHESEVSVTFSPEFQQVVFHRVCILRDGATLDQLQPARIKVVQEETDADDFQYNGLKRAFITLKDVRKGDRIEVSFSLVGFNPVFGEKYADEFSFGCSTAICNYFKTIVTASDRPLHIVTRNNAPAPIEDRQGTVLLYRWSNPPLKTWESESAAPSWYNDYPTIYITEYKDWQEVVSWGLHTFNHYQYPLPVNLQQKIAGWRKTAAGDKDLLTNLATRFVQNEIRYLGLEIGPNTHRPHGPAEVWSGRFGDCKDKALLLAVILQHEGIPACVALINTTTRQQLTTVAPSPAEFDHAIVAIPRPRGNWLFVDPTIPGQRGELADLYVPAYGYALLLREGEDSLQPVQPGRRYDYSVQETLDARYYDTSRFSVTTTYDGGAADKIRATLAETSTKDLEENYCKYYATEFDGIRQEGAITYTDDSLKNELTVRRHYSIPTLWTTGKDGRKSFDFAVKILGQSLPDPSDVPAGQPLELSYPLNIHYTLNLSLPENWDFGSNELHIKNGAYKFDFTSAVDGREMTLGYSLKTFSDHISADAMRQYKADYKNIADRIYFQLYKDNPAEAPAPAEHTAANGSGSSGQSLGSPGQSAKFCWPAIWLTLLYTLLLFRLFLYLNARSEETHYAPGSGYPLGGWIIVLGISIGSSLLLESLQFFQSGYYSYLNWTAYGNAGGPPLQSLYLAQLIIHLSFIAGAATILYWYGRRRDIFPRMFIWYTGILLSGRLLLLGLFHLVTIPPALQDYKEGLPLQLIRTGVYAGVWVAYLLRSEQVRNTFLEPHQ